MKTSMRVEGDKELIRKLQELGDVGEQEGADAVNAMSQRVRTHAVKSIQSGPKTGNVYSSIFRMINGQPVPVGPRQGNNLSPTHRASAPGEAPATDTGELVSSIKAIVSGMSGMVGTDLEYGYFLEIGTQAMEERPWLWPAVESNQAWYLDRMQEAVDRAVSRVSV